MVFATARQSQSPPFRRSQLHPRQKYSARPFYLCVLLISALAIANLLLKGAAQRLQGLDNAAVPRRSLAVLEELKGMRARGLDKKDQEVCRVRDSCFPS